MTVQGTETLMVSLLYCRSLVLASWMLVMCHTPQGITCAIHTKLLSPWSTPSSLSMYPLQNRKGEQMKVRRVGP